MKTTAAAVRIRHAIKSNLRPSNADIIMVVEELESIINQRDWYQRNYERLKGGETTGGSDA